MKPRIVFAIVLLLAVATLSGCTDYLINDPESVRVYYTIRHPDGSLEVLSRPRVNESV